MSLIRPYGDTTGDGMVQLSFTLPIEHSKVAEGAAVQLANKMGMDPALVVHAKPMGQGFTFFVVYGRVSHLVLFGGYLQGWRHREPDELQIQEH